MPDVPKTLNQLGQATSYCVSHLASANALLGRNQEAINSCVGQVGGKTKSQADASIGGIVSGLLSSIGGLLGG